MQMQNPIVLVAAVAENGIIGADNAMPWRIPSDLKHFKALTLGHPVIMGRKTFESLGRPLPGRLNIMISRSRPDVPAGVVVASSFEEALELADRAATTLGKSAIMVIGGGQIYHEAMPYADRLEITRVHARPEGDARFPDIAPDKWRQVSARAGTRGGQDSADVTYLTYERIPSDKEHQS